MALTRVTSGGIAPGISIKFNAQNEPQMSGNSPAISFEGDTDTGMYQSGSDEISFATGGVKRFTIAADGKLKTYRDASDSVGTVIGGTNTDFANAKNITLYVNQADLNSTDAEDNDGGNLNKPFKTIERALLEAAKRSYKTDPAAISSANLEPGKTYTITTAGNSDFTSVGASSNTAGVSFIATGTVSGTGTATLNNDKFEAFTVMVLPGQYEIDNRPGLDIFTNPLTQSVDEDPSDGTPAAAGNLGTGSSWRFNPRNGGVIVPRGTSIVGYDLRKTVIRPKYVPAPFSTEGSITADSFSLLQIAFDGAIMIERNRGYIIEQAELKMAASGTSGGWDSLNNIEKAACRRDIGYFIDAIIKDLRTGGNEHTFVNAEAYVDGNGYRKEFLDASDSDISGEVADTKLAFATATLAMRDIVKSHNDGTVYFTEISSGKTINRVTFTPGDGYVSNGDCNSVVNAVSILGAIADGIISNPDTYTSHTVTSIPLVGGSTQSIALRKTQGVYNQTSIFKVTGGCYFWQMTFKDAIEAPFDSVSFNSSGIPTFTKASSYTGYSHHRVVAFTYADQRNTDGELNQYYAKIDAWQGRSGDISDVRTEEFQIVGDRSKNYTIDTVNSCSPYIFNCSLRSVFGMCGMHTDGYKVAENSFKSMVVAQFTGISLQKDRDVFISPKDLEGDRDNTTYNDDDPSTAQPPIFADPDAQYKTDCRHFHIKASNGGFIQVVSVFAVGYADQFLAVSGGDMSITNSNSNFGQVSLRAKGSQFRSFTPSSQGRITALIPPRGISDNVTDVTFYNISASNTWSYIGAVGEELTDELKSLRDGYTESGGFRLYLETGATTDDDIPELVVESEKSDGTIVTKRFLNYGTSGQFALFRDFYNKDGIAPDANKIINLPLESTGGENDRTFNVRLSTTTSTADLPTKIVSGTTVQATKNAERVGYFWDPAEQCVYLKVDHTYNVTNGSDAFVNDFIFDSNEEKSFEFVTSIDPNTGITTTELQQVTKNLLKYKTGFPSSLIVKKFSDTRTSQPGDLLWKVEYTIPKYLANNVNPKPPEKRFIIKGTRPGNGEADIPYSDYRFMIWDVEEVQAWEKNSRDGVYYLTVIRADVNEFVDYRIPTGQSDAGDNVVSIIKRRPLGITATNSFSCTTIEAVNLYDKETKLIGNVNYLYPSVNEEGPTYDIRKIWNPPQSDSRVLVEPIDAGNRIKDIVVPNFKRYKTSSGTIATSECPFKDIPSLSSMTAETIHRLVQSLDLRYVVDNGSTTTISTGRVAIAPVTTWDSRILNSGEKGDEHSSSSALDLYNSNWRLGQPEALSNGIITPSGRKEVDPENITTYNTYGINKEAFDRRIVVSSPNAEGVTGTSINANALLASSNVNGTGTHQDGLKFAPKLNLYRPSILRASSHTWEYIGLGSGNYSTGFPNLQTRVLKIYEQFIAQGYENAGGFIASSGTNSAGDFYIGNQVIQAGGTSTVTLNVPKLRKSSESNYLDIENIENRISNAVINVTASAGRSASAQSALKDLANFFNIAKLTVSDKANISNLIIGERLFIDRAEINNAASFPEGNTSAYGFVKGAKPEKTGFISTDTNDKLYVSPKYLDAWRVKRQLISAQAVTLDNNRVYIQPYLQSALSGYGSQVSGTNRFFRYEGLTFSNTVVNGVTVSGTDPIELQMAETAGIASFGKLDVQFNMTGIAIQDYYVSGGNNVYFNTAVTIPLSYESVDYTTNKIVLSRNQNGLGIIDYLKSYLGNGTHISIIRNFPPIVADGAFGVNATESDVKYLKAKLETSFNAGSHQAINRDNVSEYQDLRVTIATAQEYDQWPDRGCISLREYTKGGTYYIATYKYYKSGYAGTVGTFKLVGNYGAGTNEAGKTHTYTNTYNNGYPGIDSVNVFFTGADTLAFDADRWASESPFIPPLDPTKGVVEEVNIEDAILYRVPEKKLPLAIDLDEDYFDQRLPNPYSSKALGVNIQERSEVKRFSPLFSFSQCRQWAENSGFNSTDELELLMKPGYYKLDGTKFPCSLKINGTGITTSSVFAGKEQTRVSAGRMGGYLEDTVKRGDSVYLYRTLGFTAQYGRGNDAIYSGVSGGLSANGSVSLNNVHIIGVNESITKNEIPDSIFSEDKKVQNARRLVRNAYFTKRDIIKNSVSGNDASGRPLGNTLATAGINGAIELMVKASTDTGETGHTAIAYPIVNSGDIVESNLNEVNYGELKQASFADCRYYSISIDAASFASSADSRRKFDRMRKYIIPGTTMYWLTNATDKVVIDSDSTDISNLTMSTKVISVRRHLPSTSLDFDSSSQERLEVLVSVYQTGAAQTNGNSGTYTNSVEDLNPGAWTTSLRKIVFENEDGAEYTTLTLNWGQEERRRYLPKGIMHEGGYQGPILKKVITAVTGNGTSTNTLVIDNYEDISVGDRVVWKDSNSIDQLNGFRIISIATSLANGGYLLTLSDNIPNAVVIPAGGVLSFTKFNVFGDEIAKYDIPEIYGILNGKEGSNILLVIDRNPNVIYDTSIVSYPFGSGGFGDSPTQLIQLKKTNSYTSGTDGRERASVEDNLLAFSKRTASYQRIRGIPDNRYIYLDIAPEDFAGSSATLSGEGSTDPTTESVVNYIENAGMHKDLLSTFGSYTQQSIRNAGGLGKGYSPTTITFANDYVDGTIETKIATQLASNSALTNTRRYNSRLRVVVYPVNAAANTAGIKSWRFYAEINTSTGAISAIKTYWASGSPTSSDVLNGEYKFEVIDGRGYVLSPSGRTVSTSSGLNYLSSSDFLIVAKTNLLSGAIIDPTNDSVSDGSPYMESVGTDSYGDNDPLTAVGKRIFNSWPRAYRSFRRRLPLAGMPVNGNFQSTLLAVDAIPGSDFQLNLTGVTIGAQSVADSRANTFGGGYRGGLIKCRGAQLTLNGTRFRGNLSLDWTGIGTTSGRAAASDAFIAGHSIEMFQMEDQNSFRQIGGTRPAYAITTSGDDEEFRQLSEFNPQSNIYLEPGKDPYGTLSDGDARTFPLRTKQAIRRFNKSSSSVIPWSGQTAIPSGDLLTKVALFERYQTPYKIAYDFPHSAGVQSEYIAIGANHSVADADKASAIYLRWNDSNSTVVTYTVSGGSNISLPRRSLGFFVANNDAGLDIPANIFFGTNATRLVKSDNIETSYANVSGLNIGNNYNISDSGTITQTDSGNYVFVTVNYDRSNAFTSLTPAAGTNINVNTDYLNARRYNYVSTVTSRYQKVTQNRTAKLIVAETSETINYSEPANYSVSNEDAVFSSSFTTSTVLHLVNVSDPSGTTSGRAVITTDSSNRLTSLYITDPGVGHQTGQQLRLRTSDGGADLSTFQLTVRSNYSDEDFSLFQPGEYKVMLPKNCFILNSIESGNSAKNLKQQINKAKSIFKPGSYILYGGLYYKIAKSDLTNNKSYIGVYRYVNTDNTSDIRADIVVELEDGDQVPTYSQNTRFDLFDYDNILDYWPTSGRVVIGKRETCDFEKGGTSGDNKGYEIRLTRSMTKYWPHYIRDWEGLDPNNSTDDAVASEAIIPTEIRLSDPVDVTCYGLKRFSSANDSTALASPFAAESPADITEVDAGICYTTPTGVLTDQTAVVSITSSAENVNADFEKISIGQTVTIPYRNISQNQSTGNWNNFIITVGDPQGDKGTNTSTNKEGDRFITGTFRTTQGTVGANDQQTFNIHGLNTNDTSIYEYISPLTTAQFAPNRLSISQFNARGFRQRGSYLGIRAGVSLTTSQESDTSGTGLASNLEGATHFTISPAYSRLMQRVSTWGTYTATFEKIDASTDQFEVIMDVTNMADGGIYKGQPIYTTCTTPTLNFTGSAGSWTQSYSGGSYSSANLIGYVVGMRGDTITSAEGTQGAVEGYEDGLELTGDGGTGTYRVLLTTAYSTGAGPFGNLTFNQSSNTKTTSATIHGKQDSLDYFPYGSNQQMWWNEPGNGVYRLIYKRKVREDGTNVIYFRYSGGTPVTGLTDVGSSGYSGGTSLNSGNYVLLYYQGYYDNSIRIRLDKPLSTNILEGTKLRIAPTPNRTNKSIDSNFLFKSKIIDMKKVGSGTNTRIRLYLADPLPRENWQRGVFGSEETLQSNTNDSPVKTYGMMYINDGGWTYPKTGGSSFRPGNVNIEKDTKGRYTDKNGTVNSNADIGTHSDEIWLPNRSGRVRAGDILSYSWEDILRVNSRNGIDSYSGSDDWSNASLTAATNTSTVSLGGSNADKLITVLRPGYQLFNSAGDEIGTISSINTTSITLVENAKVAVSGVVNWTYTSTGKIINYKSTISEVAPPDSHGYSKCTISAGPDHILHGRHHLKLKDLLATIDEVYVSHRLGNFVNDGPIVKTFIYSDTGVKLSFGEYRMWYENYGNYIRPIDRTRQAMSGRQGWVGNFGLSTSGKRAVGISLNGASSIQRGRQYNSGMWLTAVPVHAWWESTGYETYMLQSDKSSSIENNYVATTTPIAYDGAGSHKIYALNHTKLTTGSVYSAVNTGASDVGAGSFDTQHYRLLSTNTKLKYSLQNGTVSSTGAVSGGDSARLSEQFAINNVITYKVTHGNDASGINVGTLNVTDSQTFTASSGTKHLIQVGDVIYDGSPSGIAGVGRYVGIVKTADYSGSGTFTLTQKTANTGFTGSNANCFILTSRGFITSGTDGANIAGGGLVFSGDSASSVTLTSVNGSSSSPNIIANNTPGFNKYNIRFNIDRRVYNQTTLINTFGNLQSVNGSDNANKVVDVRFGDLAQFASPMINVEVTRFNAKTHVESSISVVGANLHI